MYKSIYNLPCACILMRNGQKVNFSSIKGKERRINIYVYFEVNIETPSLSKHPYLQLEPLSSNEKLYRCGLYQIQKITQTLINHGKVTLEIIEGEEKIAFGFKSPLNQKKMAHLMLSNSNPESLTLFINKIKNNILIYSDNQKQQIKEFQNGNDDIKKREEHLQLNIKITKIKQFAVGFQQSIHSDSINQWNQSEEGQEAGRSQKSIQQSLIFVENLRNKQNETLSNQIQIKSSLDKEEEEEEKINEEEIEQTDCEQILVGKINNDQFTQVSIDLANQQMPQIEQENHLGTFQEKILNPFKLNQISSQPISDEKNELNKSSQESEVNYLNILNSSSLNSDCSQSKDQQHILLNEEVIIEEKINQTQGQQNNPFLETVLESNEFVENKREQVRIETNSQHLEDSRILTCKVSCQLTSSLQQQERIANQQPINDIIENKIINLSGSDIIQVEGGELEIENIHPKLMSYSFSLNSEEKRQPTETVHEILENNIHSQEEEKRNNIEQDNFEEKKIKYYQQIETLDTESQYEIAQRTLQKQKEKNNLSNSQKFLLMHNKIQEIKMQKYLEKSKKDEKPQKQLYKVNQSFINQISPTIIYNGRSRRDIKRKNLFSCESEEEEMLTQQSLEQEQQLVQYTFEVDDLSSEQEEEDQGIKQSSNCISKNDVRQNSNLRETTKSDITKHQSISIKKLGKRLVQKKNDLSQSQKAVMNQQQQLSINQQPQVCYEQDPVLLQSSSLLEQLIKSLPQYALGIIFEFIDKKQIFELRTINKFFNGAVFYSIRELKFLLQNSPQERVIGMLLNAKYIQKLKLGELLYVTSQNLIDQWVKTISSSTCLLEQIDFSCYTQLKEGFLMSLLRICPQLQSLTLPFFIELSENVLISLKSRCKNLKCLGFSDQSDIFKRTQKISDEQFAMLILDTKNLTSFKIFSIGPLFLEKLEKLQMHKRKEYEMRKRQQSNDEFKESEDETDDVFLRIKSLKIDNLVLTRSQEQSVTENQSCLQIIKNFTELRKFKMNNILFKAKKEWFNQFTPPFSLISGMFEGFQKLESLCIGQWSTNQILQGISNQISTLKKIKVIGSSIDDSGLEFILQKMENLETVNIVNASRINGHCFEIMISKKIKVIKVSFDEFRMNCLKNTINYQLQLLRVKVQNFKK